MLKKLLLSIILTLSVAAAIYFFEGEDRGRHENNDNAEQVQSPIKEAGPSQSDPDKNLSPETVINEIFTLSKKGKVLHTPFVAGQTEIQEVNKKWGEPGHTTKTAKGHYANYPDHNVTIGHQDQLIFDVRSFHSELQNIHFKKIKQVKGKPDDVRYYNDDTHNQIILVYNVNKMYQLKWILPRPLDSGPNPKVHHVSVYTKSIRKDDDQKAISEVISDMSLNEKIGQMIVAGISGTTPNINTETLINKYKVGGIIFYPSNLETPDQTVRLLNQIKSENAQNRLPILLGVDQEGGRISRMPGDLIHLPTNKKIGTINNSSFSYKIGTLLGKELKAFGFNLNFAPVLDVNSNSNNPVIGDRSFGDHPQIVSKLGIETMKGIQSQNIISVIKHFPGHGDTSVDSHLKLPKVNKGYRDLKELELIPFERAIDNGADVVMTAHILLPKIDTAFPASMSDKIITGILRKQLDFNGVVMTDDMTMNAVTNNFDIGHAAVTSVKAGSDIILVAHDYDKMLTVIHALKAAVQEGKIPEERMNASVSRIIQLKRKYDIDNEKEQGVNVGELNQSIRKILNKYMD